VKGEPGLSGIEGILQLSHAALSVPEHLEDVEPRIIGERLKEPRRAREVQRR